MPSDSSHDITVRTPALRVSDMAPGGLGRRLAGWGSAWMGTEGNERNGNKLDTQTSLEHQERKV
jgi:hypothetical protein